MVDCAEHLDAIESVLGAGAAPVRVCIDVDAGWWALGGRVKVGPKRSPVHTVEQAVALAEEIERRPQIELVALMAYEGQIAGVGDRPAGPAPARRRRSASCSGARRPSWPSGGRRSPPRSARSPSWRSSTAAAPAASS